MVVALLLTGCSDRPPKEYVHDVLLPMTPIKDQGQSQLCWAYAMLATIETEHILRGDSVNLSAVYIGRMLKRNNQRAMGQTALNILQRDGVVGYDVLPDDATKELSTPKWVFMLGARYTPKEFAHSVCAPDEYLSLTCWPDSPYYKKVEVPVPDNWEHNRLLNIPLDTLKAHTDRALQHRHPVCWESRGHAMAIVGMAHDKAGKPYYVMKNSWGTDQPHGGLVYMPADEMWRDVVALYMTKEAYYNE
jgi:bleomycin hydrolase